MGLQVHAADRRRIVAASGVARKGAWITGSAVLRENELGLDVAIEVIRVESVGRKTVVGAGVDCGAPDEWSREECRDVPRAFLGG